MTVATIAATPPSRYTRCGPTAFSTGPAKM